VRLVADRDEISALVYRYAELLDGGDLDGVTDMFADATWRSAANGTVLRTRDEVHAVYDRVILYDGVPRTRHLMDNLIIDLVDGADEAAGRCYYTVLQGGEPGTPIAPILAGRYVDRYQRGPGGWRFADREFHVDLTGDPSRHFRS
jgi:3-phenylpropionate/cinnamic acid dioxygenase small subunit